MDKLFVQLQDHEGIRVFAKRYDPLLIKYIGPSLDALHAASCITDKMLECFNSGKRGGSRFRDENGDCFSRRPRKTKKCPEGVQITRWVKDVDRAISLPGVAAYLNGAHSLVQAAGSRGEPTVGELLKLFPGRGFKKRERCIGRFQRPTEWMSIGNVPLIDWRSIRAARVCS